MSNSFRFLLKKKPTTKGVGKEIGAAFASVLGGANSARVADGATPGRGVGAARRRRNGVAHQVFQVQDAPFGRLGAAAAAAVAAAAGRRRRGAGVATGRRLRRLARGRRRRGWPFFLFLIS